MLRINPSRWAMTIKELVACDVVSRLVDESVRYDGGRR